jgi:hypothetical protein
MAGVVYEDGPINGSTDAWTINFGFFVGDTFTVSGGTTTINGMMFGAWVTPGDTLLTSELTISSQPGGGEIFFDQTVNWSASGCALNQYGFDICTETAAFNGPTLDNGTYWVTLQNAVDTLGDPVYWDENSGAGCHSPGCPSQTYWFEGSIPAESFTILGSPAGTTPEPASIILFASGVATLGAVLRRKLLR